MCGIAGYVAAGACPGFDPEHAVARMTRALVHRGPDGEGLWADPDAGVWLGHRRLSVIDLSAGGAQPMVSSGGRSVLTFNGEIYNYVELAAELGVEGRSDSAVLLAACERWGIERALERLVGMFAFGLWDSTTQCLHLARDRVGKKPLYIAADGRGLAFASEVQALRRSGLVGDELDVAALRDYFTHGAVRGTRTVYAGAQELAPGHRAVWNALDGLRTIRWWSLPEERTRTVALADAADDVELKLMEAVRLRLRADVPTGVFLSGGIDSGLLTAFAARSTDSVRTFTMSFPGTAQDEAVPAAEVAQRFGTNHTTLTVDRPLEDLLLGVASTYDEPFSDPSALPTLAIARAASQHVTVVLNGEGGDELFCGYRRYQAARLAGRLGPGAQATARIVAPILPAARAERSSYAFLRRFARGLASPPPDRHLIWTSEGFEQRHRQRLLPGLGLDDPQPHRSSRPDPLDELLRSDFSDALPDGLLVKLDMATMSVGLEARCPFLDHRLVEWAFSTETSSLLPGRTTKPILRELARRHLPKSVVTAPKRGFEIPLYRWMTTTLRPLALDACLDPNGALMGLADRNELEQFLTAERTDGRWAKRAWSLMLFSLWSNGADRVHRP